MGKKTYDETSVLRSLRTVKGVSVNVSNKIIYIDANNHKAGNSTWGKIAYLCKYCGFVYSMVYDNRVKIKDVVAEEKTAARKPKRLSLANMAKRAMNNIKM